MWSLIGQFSLDWHPLIARVRLTGEGIGQLRTLETRDGKEIVERLEAIDNAKRFLSLLKRRRECLLPITPARSK